MHIASSFKIDGTAGVSRALYLTIFSSPIEFESPDLKGIFISAGAAFYNTTNISIYSTAKITSAIFLGVYNSCYEGIALGSVMKEER